jgi:sugar phosphate permease
LREPARGAAETSDKETTAANPSKSNETPQLSWREAAGCIFRDPTAILLLLAFAGANCVATVFLTWAPTFLVEKFGFRLTMAGLSGSVFIHLASAVTAPLGGWLADRWSRRRAAGRVLVQATGLLVGSVFVLVVGATQRVGVLILTMTVFGCCKGLYDANIFASLFDFVEPRARGTAAGLMNTVGWFGGALGPVTVGWLSQHGRHPSAVANMSEAISACALIYIMAAGLLFWAGFLMTARTRKEAGPERQALQEG